MGLIVGATAGAVAGILFAPDKGSKTRKKLKKDASRLGEDAKDNVHDKVDDLKDHLSDFVDDIKGRISEIEKDIKTRTKEAEKKVEDTL